MDSSVDFPLRGFAACGDCGKAYTAGWTKGRTKHYGYYCCHTKGCSSYGKSIKKSALENAFEKLLSRMQPQASLFNAAMALFKKAWNERIENRQTETSSLKKQLVDADRKIGSLLDRVLECDSPTIANAYENKVKELEDEKIILKEKIDFYGQSLPDYEQEFRTALELLKNLRGIWVSGDFKQKNIVQKLCFTEMPLYTKNTGFRTASIARPFRLLEEFKTPISYLVVEHGTEPASAFRTR